MKIIGLTGNMGSGKSLAAAILAEMGAACINADQVGHDVLASTGPAYAGVLAAFGPDFLTEQGELDRRRLGAYVFGDALGERARLLNSLTHPYIFTEIKRRIAHFRAEGYAMIVIEAALLFESGLDQLTDENWLIAAPRDLLLRRAALRDSCDPALVAARLDAQMGQEALMLLSQRVIWNDGDQALLRQRLLAAYRQISEN